MFFINTKRRVINTQIIKKGEDFSVELGSSAGTGYGWQFNYNPTRIEFVDKKAIPPDIPGGITEAPSGVPTSDNYVFRGLKNGISHITAKYVRSWEDNAFPQGIKTYTIFVY